MVKTLKQAEEVLRVISENVNDLIVVTDLKGRRISSNSAYDKLIGNPDTLIGTDYTTEVHSDDLTLVKSGIRSAAEGNSPVNFTHRLSLTNGNVRILESKIIRLIDDKDRPINLIIFSRDITEATESQRELRILVHAIGCTKDVFLLTDMNNKLIFVNPATREMYGYSEKELLGKDVSVLRSINNPADILKQMEKATLERGWNGELLNRRKDGTEFPIELWTSTVRDESNKPVAFVGVARDITNRKQSEERYKSTAAQLQLTLDNLNIVAFELDSEGNFLLSRGKGLEKLGLKPDQIIGLSIYEVYKNNPEILKMVKKAYTGEWGEADIEVAGVIWNTNYIPIKNSEGKVEHIFGTAIDVTARKHAEDALSYETDLWHTLMDSIPDTIYFKDIDSRFTRVNKAQCNILRIQNSKEAVGKSDADYFTPEHAAIAINDEKKVIRTGESLLGKIEKVTTIDGKTRWFSTTKVPMRNKQGKIVGTIGSSRDISELKQAEEVESALYRIAEETSSAADFQILFSAIHTIISGLMYARNFYIALYDNENDLLSFPYFVDEVDVPPEPAPPGRGLTAYVLRTGKSLLCDIKVSDELEKRGEAELVGVPCPIWLGVPLVVEGKTIGVMVVQHYTDPTAYTEREKQILEFVSTQVAKAIERKRSTDALKQSEDRYRAFIEQSSEGIWRFETEVPISLLLPEDEQIRLFFKHYYLAECNNAMAQMYGYNNAGEIIGLKLSDMLVSEDPHNYEIFQNFIRSGYRMTQAETRERDRYGNAKIFLNNFVGIIEEHSLYGWWGTQLDVTERRQAEELIKQSEEKYRTLFEDSQDCIILTTPEGNLIDINPAGVEMFGFSSREELLKVGNARELYFNPVDRESFTDHLAQYTFVKDIETAIKRKHGEKRVVLENSSVFRDAEGSIIGYRSFLRDITERKNLEDQLRQSQKMESIGTLAGGIAHEFNNLLGIILGYASILTSAKHDEQRLTQGVETIKKAVQRGADLVRQLLTFARKGDTTFGSVNLNELINELIEMLKQTFPKTINITNDLTIDIPLITADSSQIHVALLNLCVNARDAMIENKPGSSGGGTLTISTGIIRKDALRLKFAVAQADKYVYVSVRDTGTGMDEEIRNRMFEPFFTTKELGKGTGLGLAVVYGVVNSHYGYVEVDSTKGVGTMFTVYFPVAEGTDQIRISEKEVVQTVTKGNETILIVEDEEMLTSLLKSILEDQGYKVFVASDGQTGLDLYKENKEQIQLILADMGLPRLGGYEMFMKMKEINPDVKAILASGYFEPNLKVELVNAGAKDFIQKPYVTEIIMQRIREVLDEG